MLKGIDETLNSLLACLCTALEAADRPVCTCGTTVGAPAIANCCECSPDRSGELWGSLLRVFRSSEAGYQDATPRKPCAPVSWAAEFSFTLARCFPTLGEDAELPSVEERSDSAAILHADLATVHRAIHCCTETEPPYLQSISVDTDPQGGCSFLTAVVRVPVSLRAVDNAV